jgi:endonuclease/exonuclease/phosphatase family metal-dependent hydrolase
MKRLVAFTRIALLIVAASTWALAETDVIKVMTRNEYLGADIAPVLQAQTPSDFLAAAKAALTQVALNDFPRRADGLAREVFLTRPDVIGLQEVENFTVNGHNTTVPFIDYLSTTLDKLSALGLHYVVAGTVEHVDFTIPIDINGDGIPEAVRILDRDVILVRAGLAFTPLRGSFLTGGLCGVPIPNPVPNPPFPAILQSTVAQDGCNYTVFGVVNTPAGAISIKRGFLGVDVLLGGKTYRVVDTHLEEAQPDPTNPASAILQTLQAVELAGTLHATARSDRQLVLLGDFNSSPTQMPVGSIVPPYFVFAGSGFNDVWATNPLALLDPNGFTCCQKPDLSNRISILNDRIDLIFVRDAGELLPLAVVTGRLPLLAFRPPFWASDHGGVFGTLIFGH